VPAGQWAKVINPKCGDFASHVEGHLAQEITFLRRDGIDFPTFTVISQFDSREMIEMAHDEDAGGVELLKNGFGIFDGAVLIKFAGRANAIGERVRRTAIGVNPRAEDDCDVGRAAVVSFAEEKHLGERKEGNAGEADDEGGKQPSRVLTRGAQIHVSAAGLRHSRGP